MNLKRFLHFMKHALLVAVMLTVVGISGCDDDEEKKPTKTIWELVQADASLSMVEAQLLAAGLDDDLSGDGPFTLFAPSDAAMSTLLLTLGLDDFSSISPAVVQAVLAYHIVASQNLYADLDGNLVTLQGESITVVENQTGDKELDTGATSNASITTKNVKATNGVIHIVSTVIVPPTLGALLIQTLGTVAQPLLLASDFTTLAAAIRKADEFAAGASAPTIVSMLLADDITVFAQTNRVFEGLPGGPYTEASFTGQQWYGILRNQIVSGDYSTADDYTVGVPIPTVGGGNLTPLTKSAPTAPPNINTGIALDSNGDVSANGQIAVLDVLAATGATPANNGYINIIAGILSPI